MQLKMLQEKSNVSFAVLSHKQDVDTDTFPSLRDLSYCSFIATLTSLSLALIFYETSAISLLL